MREILFRGFHEYVDGETIITVNDEKKRGKWVEGDLIQKGNTETKSLTHRYIFNWDGEFEIIFETVSQYAGLTDKFGTKAFDNSIIKVKGFNNEFMSPDYNCEFRDNFSIDELKGEMRESFITAITFEDCCFMINTNGKYNDCLLGELCGNPKHSQPIFEFEVIGNIFENPELLKSEVNNG